MDKFTLTINTKTITVQQSKGQPELFTISLDGMFAGYIINEAGVFKLPDSDLLSYDDLQIVKEEIEKRL